MANLIITIISIAIIGIAAAMGVYYGGIAFQDAQISAVAAAIISESNQILTAQRMYAVNHGQADATNVDFNMLVTDGELSVYPPIGGGQLGVVPGNGYGAEDYEYNTTYNYNGYQGQFAREPFTYNSGNYILYSFFNLGFSNNPKNSILLVTEAINQQLGLPAGITLHDGLPAAMTSNSADQNTPGYWFMGNAGGVVLDTNGNPMTNMCYYYNHWEQSITCIFGPS